MNLNKGFSLIEVMVVVAIIAILAAVAYPSYQSHVVKTYRRDCQAALEGLANALERHYTTQVPSTYAGAAASGADTGSPSIYATQAPIDGSNKACNLSIQSADATSYIISATPISGSVLNGDGVSSLTSQGVRCWYEGDTAYSRTTTTTCSSWN